MSYYSIFLSYCSAKYTWTYTLSKISIYKQIRNWRRKKKYKGKWYSNLYNGIVSVILNDTNCFPIYIPQDIKQKIENNIKAWLKKKKINEAIEKLLEKWLRLNVLNLPSQFLHISRKRKREYTVKDVFSKLYYRVTLLHRKIVSHQSRLVLNSLSPMIGSPKF